MRAFVWDLADEGVENVLERLKGNGVDGLHVALVCHGGRFYCPHNPRHAVINAPDGAMYFQPSLPCYEGLRPRVHPEYGSGAFVGQVGEALRAYEMQWTAWVVLLNNLAVSMAHPECTCRNALGDRLEGALCPSHPAVRNYAQVLVEDLAHRVGVDAIELEDFAFMSHENQIGASWRGITIGPNLGYLLSLCLCEHCRQRAEEANIDVEDLDRRIEQMIRLGLAGDLSERRISDEITDPYHPISRFARVRSETVTTLLDELAEAAQGSRAVLQPLLSEEPDDIWRWGIELSALRERVGGATLATGRTASATQAYLERYIEMLQMNGGLVADIHLNSPCMSIKGYFETAIEACHEAGIRNFVFSPYGLTRLDMLDLIGVLARR